MPPTAHVPPTLSANFDVRQKFVRIRQVSNDGYVEFNFAIGDPALSVELVMLKHDFQSFCASNGVRHLSPEEAVQIDFDDLKWRYGRPGVSE